MTTQQVVARVSDDLGIQANRGHLHAAIKGGFVRPVGRFEDGWYRFDESAVPGLIRYMREKSHTYRRSVADAEAVA